MTEIAVKTEIENSSGCVELLSGVQNVVNCRPLAQQLLERDGGMGQRRQQAEQHHHKEVWAKVPHTTQHQKVTSKSSRQDPAKLGYPNADAFGPTSNPVGNHMTHKAKQIIEDELKGIDTQHSQKSIFKQISRTSLNFPERVVSSPTSGIAAPLGGPFQDSAQEYYNWSDNGANIDIRVDTLQLGCDTPHVMVEFGLQTVGIEVFNGRKLRYKLKVPKLFAQVSWEHCTWFMIDKTLVVHLVKLNPDQEWKKLHSRMIFERLVPLQSVSESILQLKKIKLYAQPLLQRNDSTKYIRDLLNNSEQENTCSVQDQQMVFQQAKSLMEQGSYVEAADRLESIARYLCHESEFLGQVVLKLAECHGKNGEDAKRLECLSWLVQRFAGSEVGTKALLQRAYTYQESERLNLAILDLKMVLMFDQENEVAKGLLRRLMSVQSN
eukprot:TRINITY_DN3524_c0_g2_i10.p1 TRINITY_DN3524_c0_g2~~TRINITY_DN3524_c0_g2_i10.p1  ORF type:complete len:437 (-),score=34.78 TRINITY_DN3524_c0_g2_i10:616-1926(-)